MTTPTQTIRYVARPFRGGGTALAALLALLLLGTASLWALPACAAETSPLVGHPAPQLSGRAAFSAGLMNLNRLQNDIVSEKDAQGQPVKENGKVKFVVVKSAVVLNFFATYCVPCIQEIPVYNKLALAYADKPVKFVYVNVDTEKSADEVRDFAKSKGIEVEMMMPSVRYAVQAYKIDALPRIVIVDKEGIVAHVIMGFQEDLTVQMNRVLAGLLSEEKPPAKTAPEAKGRKDAGKKKAKSA